MMTTEVPVMKVQEAFSALAAEVSVEVAQVEAGEKVSFFKHQFFRPTQNYITFKLFSLKVTPISVTKPHKLGIIKKILRKQAF